MPFCTNCGEEVPGAVTFCPECGSQVDVQSQGSVTAEPETWTRVNAWAAVVFSVTFPGLGQLYMGEGKRGVLFVVAGLAVLLTILIEVGIILYPVLVLVSALDASGSAGRINDENVRASAVPHENAPRSSRIAPPFVSLADGKANSYAIGGCSQMGVPVW